MNFDLERNAMYTYKKQSLDDSVNDKELYIKKPLPINYVDFNKNPFENSSSLYTCKKDIKSEISTRLTDLTYLPQAKSYPILKETPYFNNIPINTRQDNISQKR
jgi:hypothetical protein